MFSAHGPAHGPWPMVRPRVHGLAHGPAHGLAHGPAKGPWPGPWIFQALKGPGPWPALAWARARARALGFVRSCFWPCLDLLGLPRLASASLALPAPRNNSPAAFGGRAVRSAAAVVAGAGKASEADARRGEPSKARPGAYNPCASGTTHVWEHFQKFAPR